MSYVITPQGHQCSTPHHGLRFRRVTGRVSQARTRTHIYVVSAPFRMDLSDGWQLAVKRYGRVEALYQGLPSQSVADDMAEHHAGEVKAGIIPLTGAVAPPPDPRDVALDALVSWIGSNRDVTGDDVESDTMRTLANEVAAIIRPTGREV